jgi:hypothetical protein
MGNTPTIDWSNYQKDSATPSIDFTKYEGGAAVPPKDETGVWAGIKRNTVGMVSGLYHAFSDPATPEEKSQLLEKIRKENANGENIPEELATNPSTATLALHRIISNPSDLLGQKSDKELKAAKELWDKGEHWKGANLAASGATDKALSAVPVVGPAINQTAERAEKGDVSGAVTDVGAAVLASKAPEIVKGVAEKAPDIVRGGWRKIGNPMGLASTGQELLTQGISPRTSLLNFKPSLERAAGDLKAYDAQSPIKNVQDLHDAIPEIKQKIWSEEVEPALQRQAGKPVNMKPVADAVRGQISDEMRTFDEGNAEALDKLADKLDSAKDVKSANSLLKYVNGKLETYFQKFPAARKANLMNNPETAGWEAARAELRNQFLGTLEDAGETGVRDARMRYGAMDTLQDAVERRVNVADRAKPMPLSRIVGLAAAVPTGGLSVVAGEIANYLNKPDVLIRRGISKLPEPTPIRTTPFASTAEGGNFAYRVRSQGEEGIPIGGVNEHAHATATLEDAQKLAPGRESIYGEPQEITKVDLSKLKQGVDYERIQRPGQPDWIKFKRPLSEKEVQIVKSSKVSIASPLTGGAMSSPSELFRREGSK